MLVPQLLGIIAIFLTAVLLAIPLGRYIARVYAGERTLLDPVMGPVERILFRISGVDAAREMNWKEHLRALLAINLLWFLFGMLVLMTQAWLPLNPDGNPNMSPHLAFNTSISFMVNCNLQHYSGEGQMSYFSQVFFLMFMQFVTAGTGMAAAAMVFNAMRGRSGTQLGNFYNYFVKSCTRILLPLSVVVAVVLVFNGTPMNWEGKDSIVTLEGDSVQVSRGPAAAMIAIKQLGTNGGGYFGVNSAHPLENPTYFANAVSNVSIILIPMAMVFALGHYLRNRRLGWMIFGVMTVGVLLLLTPAVVSEWQGNPELGKMGIVQENGSMEGKEVRNGSVASAFWGVTTTVTSNGSVNSMHDSHTPLSGAMELLGMMVNSLYGGVGVGFLGFYIFIILAVFISGLLVGRTPEFLGKKVEAREVKIAMIVALLHPFLILVGTALAAALPQYTAGTYPNPGAHGFSEMLYEYSSSAANNGSGFEGLGDNTPWWNISTGIVLILSRFIPMIGPMAIAGLLAAKRHVPDSAGTLKTDTATFGMVVFAVIFIVAALAFFPALALGPLAEHFQMH